jgi:catechol 2,3-dioxygenase-like lactoylglutathione lyase family enzyme
MGSVKPFAVHHVSVNVADTDRSLQFYTKVLGLTQRGDRPDIGPGAWLDAGGQQVHLIQASVPPNLGQHLALQVEDLASAIAELRATGIEVSDPSPIGRNMQSFLQDPDGNGVELHQAAAE